MGNLGLGRIATIHEFISLESSCFACFRCGTIAPATLCSTPCDELFHEMGYISEGSVPHLLWRGMRGGHKRSTCLLYTRGE